MKEEPKDNSSTLDKLLTIEETNVDKNEVLKELMQKDNINLKTELTDQEILNLSRLQIIGKKTNSSLLLDFCNEFKELRVSKNRQGRKEIIGAFQDPHTQERTGFLNNIFGGIMGGRQ